MARPQHLLAARDLITAALYESGASLAECGRRLGISREGVRRRLLAAGVERRPVGSPSLPPWQRPDGRLLRAIPELEALGLTRREACSLLGVGYYRSSDWSPRPVGGSHRQGQCPCRLRETAALWHEMNYLMIERAWRDGAAVRDVAEILGTTEATANSYLHRMRCRGYDLPRRRP